MSSAVASPSSSSLVGPDLPQAITPSAEEHQPDHLPITPVGLDQARVAALIQGVHQLVESPDPDVVFTQLAALLAPAMCERATVTIYSGNSLASWEQGPALFADIPTTWPSPHGQRWTLTVHTAGRAHPDGTDPAAGADNEPPETGYIAALTCHGIGEPLTAAEIALIKMAARYAAGIVHQTRQTQLLAHHAQRAANLQIALRSNRTTGAAVGILMAQHLITYPQAFSKLTEASQRCNTKLAAIAEQIVDTGVLPSTM